ALWLSGGAEFAQDLGAVAGRHAQPVSARQPDVGLSYNLTHVLYSLGGLIAIGSMTQFMGICATFAVLPVALRELLETKDR
ncbi:MAG TPA: hypothetical protein VFN16_07665, partial [Saccharospirillum sp.]|nr:hypothetical protein [Saccharospirillum sp.]